MLRNVLADPTPSKAMLMTPWVQTPVEAVERLFADLVSGQVEAGGRELQAATTLLLVALSHFRVRRAELASAAGRVYRCRQRGA